MEVIGMLEFLRTSGVPAGIGTHRPDLIEHCVKDNWDPDFYFACMYNVRKNREGEESGFITGKTKSGVKTDEERCCLNKETYDIIYTTLKPNDFAAMGIVQKYHDQLTENVSIFNEWACEQE